MNDAERYAIRPVPETTARQSPWWAICDSEGHPPMTHHPQHRSTWCLCGLVIHPGDADIDMDLRARLRAEREAAKENQCSTLF